MKDFYSPKSLFYVEVKIMKKYNKPDDLGFLNLTTQPYSLLKKNLSINHYRRTYAGTDAAGLLLKLDDHWKKEIGFSLTLAWSHCSSRYSHLGCVMTLYLSFQQWPATTFWLWANGNDWWSSFKSSTKIYWQTGHFGCTMWLVFAAISQF